MILPVPLRIAARWLSVGAGLCVVAAAAAYCLLLAKGFQPLVMLTGSMGRTIPVGSLVLDRTVAPEQLRVGDVISFEKPAGTRAIDTHRIVRIETAGATRYYHTKGDASPAHDPWRITIPPGQSAHRVAFVVPRLGYALLALRNPLARLAIIAWIALSLARAVWRSAGATREQRTARSS